MIYSDGQNIYLPGKLILILYLLLLSCVCGLAVGFYIYGYGLASIVIFGSASIMTLLVYIDEKIHKNFQTLVIDDNEKWMYLYMPSNEKT